MKKLLLSISVLTSLITGCEGSSSETDNGNLTNNQIAHGNGYFNTHRIERNAQGIVTSNRFYEVDSEKNRVAKFRVLDSGETELIGYFYYNEFGYITLDEQLDDSGLVEETLTYTHSENGLIAGRQRVNTQDSELNVNRTFTYDTQNRLMTSQEIFSLSNQLSEERAYQFDEAGLLTKKIVTDYDQGEVDSEFTSNYIYNQQNQQIARETDFGSNGSVETIRTLEYDNNGNVILSTVNDSSGAVIETTTYEYSTVSEPIYNVWVRRFLFFP